MKKKQKADKQRKGEFPPTPPTPTPLSTTQALQVFRKFILACASLEGFWAGITDVSNVCCSVKTGPAARNALIDAMFFWEKDHTFQLAGPN